MSLPLDDLGDISQTTTLLILQTLRFGHAGGVVGILYVKCAYYLYILLTIIVPFIRYFKIICITLYI